MWRRASLPLNRGDKIDREALIARLLAGGYARVDRVLATGEFSMVGGQADIFPPDAEYPFRLVLFDDEIEEIRLFSPETQRSVGKEERLRLLPVSECDLSPEGAGHFCRAYRREFGKDDKALFKRLLTGAAPPGCEFYLPLFYDAPPGRLFDYLPPQCAIVLRAQGRATAADFLRQARGRQKVAGMYENRHVLPASRLFLQEDDFFAALNRHSLLELEEPQAGKPPPVAANARLANPRRPLFDFIAQRQGGADGGRLVLAVDGKGRRDSLRAVLAAGGAPPALCETFDECLQNPLSLTVAPLRAGFCEGATFAFDGGGNLQHAAAAARPPAKTGGRRSAVYAPRRHCRGRLGNPPRARRGARARAGNADH